jgi:2-keto-4-pentenoate hydratase
MEKEMSDKARQAADLLLAARANPRARIAALPEALRPADRAEAYAIQRLVAASFPGIGGWKVGAANPTAEPQCGALPTTNVVASPASFSGVDNDRFIETEVCFTIGHDLPPRAEPYTREEIIAAMATAHPAIEFVSSRYIDGDAVDAFSGLADSQAHFALIVGPGRADWHGIDFDAQTAEQYVDGALHRSHMGNPGGDMVRLVQWLANIGAVWAGGLKAGQIVTCGSWTGKAPVGPTAAVRAHFPALGDVSAQYTAG